jgi:hypothetical protein
MSLSSRATWLVLLLASRLAFAAPPPRVKQPESPAEERRRWVRERPVVDFDMGYAVGVGLRHAPSTHDDVDPVLFNSLWSTFTLHPNRRPGNRVKLP